ncbi:MAG: hypothetical protein U0136_17255 [Bdellovibrionota bacterium]
MSSSSVVVRVNDWSLEPQLARFAAALPSEGAMQLRLDRPLGFKASFDVEGERAEIITALLGGEVVGLASRAERLCYLNGRPEPQTIGVLGNLRIRPDFRSTLTLARGLKAFHELDRQGRAKIYLAFVQSANSSALALFERPRKLMPPCRPGGQLYTVFLRSTSGSLGRSAPRRRFELRRATKDDLPSVAKFLRSHGSNRQFFPHYSLSDLLGETTRLRGLRPDDIILCSSGGALMGCTARWSQSTFRRWVVERYAFGLKSVRPLYNALAPLFGRLRLPAEGELMQYDFLALLCTANDDPDIVQSLVAEAAADAEAPLVTTVHERDPRARQLLSKSRFTIRSRMFIMQGDGCEPDLDSVDARVPHIEAGTL